jgi:glycine/D-amino acid oxidase-like deaminating enzyme
MFTPDGRPLLGWMPGQRNHFAAAGFLAGISMSGGFGQLIAEWIVDGAPHRDLSSCDVLRFGSWA